jgi:hypothetical protein
VLRFALAVSAALLLALAPAAAASSYESSAAPLSANVRAELRNHGFWHKGCPVALSGLRVLTVSHWGWDGRRHTGRLIVNAAAVAPLGTAFRRLYALHFPIRHLTLKGVYGPVKDRVADPSGSFECRQAVPSPCVGGTGTGTWSMHAYGLAVDINPTENPYVGCGASRSPTWRRYSNRARHLKGMVTPRTVGAFRSVGWGWGGAWTGNTKDYMHFSSSGH